MILTINSGSSSVKCKIYTQSFKSIFKAQIDNIGKNAELWTTTKKKVNAKNHDEAIQVLLRTIKEHDINTKEIKIIGHRVVHGGEIYTKPVLITPKVLRDLKKLSEFAPLHNPHNIAGILACQKALPAQNIAVFDTGFHQSLPKKAYTYALPFKVRKYGFHGISHEYVSKEARKYLRKEKWDSKKIITCHLGNGGSITAVKNGKSIETSMGFTPLAGIPMGTRSGDFDPAIIPYINRKEKLSFEEIEEKVNKSSGFLAIANKRDMRDIYKASLKGEKKSKFLIEYYSYAIAKYIGSYITILGGLDSLVFTGGLGNKAHYIRKKVCSYLSWLGAEIDTKKNRKNNYDLSAENSKIKILNIKTDEELEIAKEAYRSLKPQTRQKLS